MDRVAVTERPWDDMTPDERRDEMDRAAAELLRPLRMIVPELEGIASDVETLRQEIAEIRGMFDEQRRRNQSAKIDRTWREMLL
jgi:hypothetical protein